LEQKARVEVDAATMLVFPGAVDCHAHLNDPGFEWREDFSHGTAAAAAGGVTTVIDMPLQITPALTTAAILENKLRVVAPKAIVDFAFLGGLVDTNIDALEGLREAGVVGLKAFMGPVSPDYSTIDLALARRALEITAEWGLVVAFHCEDYHTIKRCERLMMQQGRNDWKAYLESRPLAAEIDSVRNVIRLAEQTGARVHICHVSHPDVAEEIKQAQNRAVNVSCETCMHYLVYNEHDLLTRGSLYKCAPPLRKAGASEGLWEYVIDGTIACIASDHSPCAPEEKREQVKNNWELWGGHQRNPDLVPGALSRSGP
jgi:allantoinase